MAKEFVRQNGSKRVEDVAREYMEKLIQRSFVMVGLRRSIGGVKTCRIHDLIHDFCQRKAKHENFFNILSQRDDAIWNFNERLSITSDPIHFKNGKLFCRGAHSTLFSDCFDLTFSIQTFKLLKVLDVQGACFVAEIPSEIELLTQLRYLSIRSSMRDIPSSLGNLLNFETLIGVFLSREVLSFPCTFWNLHKLKWLKIARIHGSEPSDGFTLLIQNLENYSVLLELETLCGVAFSSYGSMEQQMRKFPNTSRLKCSILHGGGTTHFNKIVIADFLKQLECLSISGSGRLQCELCWSENLRRLSFRGFSLSKEEMADIGTIPNLEVLKLVRVFPLDGTLDMEEGEFSKLRYLKLVGIRIKRWTVSDEQLPSLKKLLLRDGEVSEELPYDCLTNSSTLVDIKVYDCTPNAEDLARDIEEVQRDYGNFVRVRIERSDRW